MKTIIDAVNEFKGEWYGRKDKIYLFEKGVITCCDQFNATVSQMKTNFGKCEQSYGDYKIKFALDKLFAVPESVNHRCTISTVKEPVLKYTQAMADKGELPSAGMECQTSTGIITVKYIGKKIVVADDFEGNEFQMSKKCALHALKPLATPIELIHGEAYNFIDSECNNTNGIYSEDEHSFTGLSVEWLADRCTNIQPLTVEVK
jgi:hypothetical protein